MNIELINNLWSQTSLNNNKCWIWTGNRLLMRGKKSYGFITEKSVNKLIHRLSLCIYLGLDYDDNSWQACHICDVQHCWNPLHLYVGTPKSNAQDRYKDQTHCVNGHPRTKENLYTNSQGSRGCRICRLEYNRKKVSNGSNTGLAKRLRNNERLA